MEGLPITFTQGPNERFVFFCSHQESANTPCFSNWYPSTFTVTFAGHRDVTFSSAESYLMFKKALLFGDDETAVKVLQTKDPAEVKRLGREVKNFDGAKWNDACELIMYEGLMAKFRQNPAMLEVLLATGDAIIAEAAWYDVNWGVGLRATDPLILDQKTWKGKNFLGKTLMKVRADLK